jgi:GTP-binding protein
MTDSKNDANGRSRYTFLIPTRGLIGFRSEFNMDTRAQGIMNHAFDHYAEHKGDIERSSKGALIAHEAGVSTNYGIAAIEPRGTLFIEAGLQIYEGMVIGEATRSDNIIVNPVRMKHLTNFRAAGKEDFVRLKPPRKMSLEETLSYVRDDELIEVTPKNVRLRKAILDPNQRKLAAKNNTFTFDE